MDASRIWKGLWAGAIGLLLLLSPLEAARTKHANAPGDGHYGAFYRPLGKQERFNHALARLTFGPRPGDVQRLEHTGLKKWLREQLYPESMPENATLIDRLRPYDSLRMSIRDVYLHYPSPQLIRAVARGDGRLPEDPELRAIVVRLARRYAEKKRPADSDGELKVKLRELFSPGEIGILETGSPEQKRVLLASIPPGKRLDLAGAIPPRERQQLLGLAPTGLRRQLMLASNPQSVVAADLAEGKILRAAYSSHQLEELLVDFWFNHFNVFVGKGPESYLLASYEREAIRPYVLGKFRDLLLATAKSPAMLFYLDNWQSVAPESQQRQFARQQRRQRGLNENYGRELLELHTLGVDGGYTQKDVVAVARCFTGWTIQRPEQDGEFQYNNKVHDQGEKVVLGHVIPAGGGMNDGLMVINILAHHPATAHFISLKLAQRFVADDPPPVLVQRMAKTFLRTDGDLRQVMQTMLKSREFWSRGAYEAKVKTPFEMVVSAVRATNAEVDSAYALVNEIRRLGEPLYQKIEPTGYSSANAEWVSSAGLLGRINFALALGQNRIAGTKIDAAFRPINMPSDADAIAWSILQREPSEQTLAAIHKLIDNPDFHRQVAANDKPGLQQGFASIAGLVVGSPEFQRH